MLCACLSLQQYWAQIIQILLTNMGLGLVLPDYPAGLLLGLFPCPSLELPSTKFLDLALILAKRAVTIWWKHPTAPSIAA